jgi:hypothetical protein
MTEHSHCSHSMSLCLLVLQLSLDRVARGDAHALTGATGHAVSQECLRTTAARTTRKTTRH